MAIRTGASQFFVRVTNKSESESNPCTGGADSDFKRENRGDSVAADMYYCRECAPDYLVRRLERDE